MLEVSIMTQALIHLNKIANTFQYVVDGPNSTVACYSIRSSESSL